MATRQIKMPRKDGSENENEEAPSQRQKAESGLYLLQVDRQTKGSYPTAEAAQSAALVIKKAIRSYRCRCMTVSLTPIHWWSCRSPRVDPYAPPHSDGGGC
jgi:hypothetical protein